MTYRPWGQIAQITKRWAVKEWDLFGSLSTEDRCLATRDFLVKNGALATCYLAQISDFDSRYHEEVDRRLNHNKELLLASGGSKYEIHEHGLFSSRNELYTAVINFLKTSKGNVILDISSLPKRFFFPILKIMIAEKSIVNLAVCYTIPFTYPANELAEDFGEWLPLPLFAGSLEKHEIYFIGAGFMAMSLADQIQDAIVSKAKVRIFIPFPGHSSSLKPVWEFIRDIQKNLAVDSLPPGSVKSKAVSARDVSEVFNYMLSETQNGKLHPLFAPYGPKPMSLAMCLFACYSKTNPSVFYTQPRVYAPDYSIGIAQINETAQIYTYCIRVNGTDLYGL